VRRVLERCVADVARHECTNEYPALGIGADCLVVRKRVECSWSEGTNAKVASSLLGIWLRGEKPAYLLTRNQRRSAVTLGDVKRVAEEVLRADRLVVTIVGMPKLAQ
jgi:hypothetical protein